MAGGQGLFQSRQAVCQRLGISLSDSLIDDPKAWHAVVSSRLGRTPLAHRLELATLFRWVQQTEGTAARPLTVAGTAADCWVMRACRLLGIEPVRLSLAVGDGKPLDRALPWPVCQSNAGRAIGRDELAIMLADRVDVAMVRRGGTIHRLLLQRLASAEEPGSVRLLVPVEPWGQPVVQGSSRVIQELIDAGAVGYCCHWDAICPGNSDPDETRGEDVRQSCDVAAKQLINHSDRWLVHCTRGRQAAWPGQSEDQFLDWLLVSMPHPADLSPLATLQRIVSQQLLVGSGRTVRQGRPVVCFSDKSVLEMVNQRVFRPHLGRWDAEPFGIAVCKQAAVRHGVRPVIYYDPKEVNANSSDPSSVADAELEWRLQPIGIKYDWTNECEWRLPGTFDLRQLSSEEAIVFVASDDQCKRLKQSKWPIVSIESLRRFSP